MSLPIPGPTADLATQWAYLEEGIGQIMTKQQVSFTKYQSLYIVAYNYCTSSGRTLHGSGDPSADLYERVESYLASHVKLLREKANSLQDEALPEFYTSEWKRYTFGANYMNRLFAYLNRYWVQLQRNENTKDVYPVYTLALLHWKAGVLDPIQNIQLDDLVTVIESQRDEIRKLFGGSSENTTARTE